MILDYECYYLKLLPFSSGCKNTQTNPSIKRQQPFCMLRYLDYFYTKPLLTLIR
ncbi:hypothetical protein HMPREF1408_00518 [Helicobacter pylori GAM245Ai]|uniref:Uncharacterized protein n=1 Tax=Helicobacter pylori Hp P-2 TaxID=992073 RepID=I9W6X8_HELPX|nr:hypothetical protein HPHPP2_0479 [Helicobacter pylori Hp P-2]EJC57702.1 hypothetical protein HPHPP2B_0484 [Helicobacter pylori Hp P-2b]EMG83109.1 hypothetical protein HMPREF1394_00635 [Helicobacter pylori GAM105Ai]EMH06245.1 hypothetical protein HMPREF1408_00518 [Helicobacter pylori GAM245Ai]